MNILLVVAHPDDEVIWCSSTLHELSKLDGIKIFVICLWAALEKPGSMQSVAKGYKDIDRKDQFYKACKELNFHKYCLVFETNSPFTSFSFNENTMKHEFINALKNIEIERFDLLITHSPYGDERQHIGHKIVHRFCKNYCSANHIAFSFFSPILLNYSHKPLLTSTLRVNELHLISYLKCDEEMYCLIFQGNLGIKRKAINIYKAIDLPLHFKQYTSMTRVTDLIYIDRMAKVAFETNILKRFTTISEISL